MREMVIGIDFTEKEVVLSGASALLTSIILRHPEIMTILGDDREDFIKAGMLIVNNSEDSMDYLAKMERVVITAASVKNV